MIYKITTFEEEHHRYYYEVEANSEEEAKEKIRIGEVQPESSKFVSGETISMEVDE